jgi:hypothetical protein
VSEAKHTDEPIIPRTAREMRIALDSSRRELVTLQHFGELLAAHLSLLEMLKPAMEAFEAARRPAGQPKDSPARKDGEGKEGV